MKTHTGVFSGLSPHAWHVLTQLLGGEVGCIGLKSVWFNWLEKQGQSPNYWPKLGYAGQLSL